MATTKRGEETRGILDGLMDGMTSDTDDLLVLRVLELQFLREISDGLEAIQDGLRFLSIRGQ